MTLSPLSNQEHKCAGFRFLDSGPQSIVCDALAPHPLPGRDSLRVGGWSETDADPWATGLDAPIRAVIASRLVLNVGMNPSAEHLRDEQGQEERKGNR